MRVKINKVQEQQYLFLNDKTELTSFSVPEPLIS